MLMDTIEPEQSYKLSRRFKYRTKENKKTLILNEEGP